MAAILKNRYDVITPPKIVRLIQKLAWMIRSARGPDMPNLVEIGSRRSSGEMCVFWNYHSFFTYIYIYIYTYTFFFLRPTYRSDPWTDLDAQYTKTRGIMQGTNLWGLKLLKLTFTPFLAPKCRNFAQKVDLENFRPKRLTVEMLESKLPLIVIVAPWKLYSE